MGICCSFFTESIETGSFIFRSPFKGKLDPGPREFGSRLTWPLWSTGKSSWESKSVLVQQEIPKKGSFSTLNSELEPESEPELDPLSKKKMSAQQKIQVTLEPNFLQEYHCAHLKTCHNLLWWVQLQGNSCQACAEFCTSSTTPPFLQKEYPFGSYHGKNFSLVSVDLLPRGRSGHAFYHFEFSC